MLFLKNKRKSYKFDSTVKKNFRFGRSAGAEEPEEQFVAKRKNEFIRFG